MAPGFEASAKKLKVEEAPFRAAPLGRVEKRLNLLRRAIENDTANTDFAFAPAPAKPKNHLSAFILTDLAGLVFGFFCAWALAATVNAMFFGRSDLYTITAEAMTVKRAVVFSLISLGVIVWFNHAGHYQVRQPLWAEVRKVVELLGFAMLLDVFLQAVVRENFSRLWLLSGWIFAGCGILVFRALWRRYLRARGLWDIPTLVVGNGPTADEARAALQGEPRLGYTIVAQVKDLLEGMSSADSSWVRLCRSYGAQHVVVALDGEDFMEARHALAQLMREDMSFSVVPPMHNLSVFSMVPQSFMGRDVMLLTRNCGLDRAVPRFLKRAFDIVMAGGALIVFSPMLLVLALLVKADGGPAFFGHKRVGLNGKMFECLKFRSMAVNSDEVLKAHLESNPLARAEWQRDHKLRKDPRVTRVGAFLRRTSLDEIPQLLNVLKGEMSLVGPRPIIPAEMAKYEDDIAFYYRVQPGITGLWQVSGRNDVSYDERVRMDSWYVRNWSLWHDIAIICKTFPEVLNRRGAY